MRLKELREAQKMTQIDVGNALGVKQHTVSQWETGERIPRADKLPQLAKLLCCTVDDLLGDGERDSA